MIHKSYCMHAADQRLPPPPDLDLCMCGHLTVPAAAGDGTRSCRWGRRSGRRTTSRRTARGTRGCRPGERGRGRPPPAPQGRWRTPAPPPPPSPSQRTPRAPEGAAAVRPLPSRACPLGRQTGGGSGGAGGGRRRGGRRRAPRRRRARRGC